MTNTPLVKIDNFYLKREDQNPTGSAKDRAIPFQIENLKHLGFTKAVISSTGNAAISAAHFCQINQIELTIFLSSKVNQKKLDLLKQYSAEIILSDQPISDAIKYAKSKQVYLLRQSTDPSALIGYQQIALEVIQDLPQISSIFIPVGSGTTLLGIAQKLPPSTKIFAVQSASNCPISKRFDNNFIPENRLITDALSVKFIPLKDKIISNIKNCNGSAFTVQNEAILLANQLLESKNIFTSLEGSLALAGYQKAIKNGIDVGNFPVILLTGAKR